MAINDTFALTVKGTVTTQQHIHTLHFRALDPLVDEGMLIDAWVSACGTAYRAQFSNGQLPVEVIRAAKVCGSVPLPAPVEESMAGAARQGTRGAETNYAPSFIAAVAIERGTIAGRSRSGRYFIGGALTNDFNVNQWAGGYKSILDAYAAALTAEFVGSELDGPWQLVTHSRKLALAGAGCEASATPVASVVVSNNVTTMRSRKTGHGS